MSEDADIRGDDRRTMLRRRSDARSVADVVAGTGDESVVTAVTLGGSSRRRSAVYECGCVAVDPTTASPVVQILECPTHAALRAKLRRRRTDRHDA